MRIVQLLPDLVFGDAVSNDCLFLDGILKARGYETEIVVERFDGRYFGRVRRYTGAAPSVPPVLAASAPSDFVEPSAPPFGPADLRPGDLLLFHYSTWSATAEWLLAARPGRLIMVYHNITPPEFFDGANADAARLNRRALAVLPEFAEFVDLVLAKSEYSEGDLRSAGFRRTGVVPMPVDVSSREPFSEPCYRAWRSRSPVLLGVGRIAPNKRIEDLIHALSVYRRLIGDAWLLLVGPQDTAPAYRMWLDWLIQYLGLEGRVAFAGHVERIDLLAYYRAADLYLCMSEHEGFCVPVIEAMALGLPVVAYASTAVPSTMGTAGILLKRKDPRVTAELIHRTIADRRLRQRLVDTGRTRAAEFAPDRVAQRFLTYVGGLVNSVGSHYDLGLARATVSDIDPVRPRPFDELKAGSSTSPGRAESPAQDERAPIGSEHRTMSLGQDQSVGLTRAHAAVGDGTPVAPDRLRIAIVVQRYGQEVTGGAEQLARAVARHLATRHELTVLTTCAQDYRTWRNYYPPGVSTEDGVEVRRFRNDRERAADFDRWVAEFYSHAGHSEREEADFLERQGPISTDLLEHIARHGRNYDAVVFYTYLYAPTVQGLPLVSERAVLVPTAHDEAAISLSLYRKLFDTARSFVFLSRAERALVWRLFPSTRGRGVIASLGVEIDPRADSGRFRGTFGVVGDYVLYVGRVDEGKGVGGLVRVFGAAAGHLGEQLSLVLLGGHGIELPIEPWLVAPGFVDEQTKRDAIAGSLALISPSHHESLGISVLEAWAQARPVIADAHAEVILDHCRSSHGGLWYRSPSELLACLRWVRANATEAAALGRNGQRFVAKNYAWPRVLMSYDVAFAAARSIHKASEAR